MQESERHSIMNNMFMTGKVSLLANSQWAAACKIWHKFGQACVATRKSIANYVNLATMLVKEMPGRLGNGALWLVLAVFILSDLPTVACHQLHLEFCLYVVCRSHPCVWWGLCLATIILWVSWMIVALWPACHNQQQPAPLQRKPFHRAETIALARREVEQERV